MNLPGFVTRNWRLKLGCTLLAMVTWIGVVYAGNPPETRTLSVHVPQTQSSIPSHFVLVHAVPDVTVRIGGSRDHLNAFNPSSLIINVGWKSITRAGTQSIPIAITNPDAAVELVDAPTSVVAEIDTLDSVSIPVTIVITAPPPPGYDIGAESTTPDAVVVSGPHQELTGLQARVTIDLSNQKTNFVADAIPVYVFDAHGTRLGDVGVLPSTLTRLTITIAAAQTSRASAVVPRIIGHVAAGFQLSGIVIEPPTVVLSGPQDLLNALDSVSTAAVNLNGDFGNISLTVAVTPPAGVSASPSTVTVTILIAPLPAPPTPTPTPTPVITP